MVDTTKPPLVFPNHPSVRVVSVAELSDPHPAHKTPPRYEFVVRYPKALERDIVAFYARCFGRMQRFVFKAPDGKTVWARFDSTVTQTTGATYGEVRLVSLIESDEPPAL
jgi:hypothetical protein